VSGAPASAPALAIEIAGLRKVYRKKQKEVVAVDGLDLQVRRGEIFGLLGPNGAGKTTTVEICEGLVEPTAGAVRVLGRTWGSGCDRALRTRLGVCLQETKFFEKQSVRETLELFAACHGAHGARRREQVAAAIAAVSLEEKVDARQAQLSGGQKQRLAVATALLGTPELLFLDEPTTGLDPQSRRQLWDVIRGFQRGGGTVLLTTHYMEEAAQLCDRVGIVDHGRMIALGTPAELVRSLGADHVIDIEAEALGSRIAKEQLLAIPGVQQCELAPASLQLTVQSLHGALPALMALFARAGVDMTSLVLRHATLEDVFVHLTGRHLREEGQP
jgi:ABC-2 type transport system ATP-binding protein